MAGPACTGASDCFTGDARQAQGLLARAVRQASRPAEPQRGPLSSTNQPRPFPWSTLNEAGWNLQRALSAFKMRESGAVWFTGGRNVAQYRTDGRSEELHVNIFEVAGGEPVSANVGQLLQLAAMEC
eukprot:1605946-Pleurochrysis_carterae.AAC.1